MRARYLPCVPATTERRGALLHTGITNQPGPNGPPTEGQTHLTNTNSINLKGIRKHGLDDGSSGDAEGHGFKRPEAPGKPAVRRGLDDGSSDDAKGHSAATSKPGRPKASRL